VLNYYYNNEVLTNYKFKLYKFYNKYYFLVKNHLNNYYYIPSIFGLYVGDYIHNSSINYYLGYTNIIGSILPLYYLSINTVISNIKILNKIKYIKSSGCFGYILNKKLDTKIVSILLPSSKVLNINYNNLVVIGRNFNINKNKEYQGSYSYSKKLGIRPIVRGVAKNPVDHPNGGRTKAKSPELSVWGWVAKHNK